MRPVKNPDHTKAVGLLLACAVLWSLAGVLIKYIDWPPLAVAGGRGLIAGVFLLLAHRPRRFTWSPLQLGAALAYLGCTVPFAVATKLTSAANAIVLQYTAPVWVALLGAWVLGERTSKADWLAILAVFAGMGLFFAHGLELQGAVGNGLAIFSGMSFAAMAMLMRKQRDGSPIESVILGNLLGAVVGLPFAAGHPLPSARGLGALLALGVLQLGLPYLLYVRAIKHVTALEAVLIPVVEPVLNPIWVLLFIGEKPSLLAMAGGVLILAAVTWRAFASVRRAGAAPAS
ncbi:MAG: EamA family transporter [Opitutae bacterium]|nr:EamA family transporter [Opitutae bacterium]